MHGYLELVVQLKEIWFYWYDIEPLATSNVLEKHLTSFVRRALDKPYNQSQYLGIVRNVLMRL